MFYCLMSKQRTHVVGIVAIDGEDSAVSVQKKVCPSCASEILFPVGVENGMEILECEECGTRINNNGVI